MTLHLLWSGLLPYCSLGESGTHKHPMYVTFEPGERKRMSSGPGWFHRCANEFCNYGQVECNHSYPRSFYVNVFSEPTITTNKTS